LIPIEDGVRLELTLDQGKVYAVSPLPSPTTGDEVGVRVTGGVSFTEAREDRGTAWSEVSLH
jgi:hypothetical protein